MALYDARQSVYVSGDTILAAHSNDELDRILAAFNKTTGHLHGGSTTGDGPKLVVLGAVNSGSITSGFGTIDIGSSTFGTTGTITGPSGTWDSGGMDIATGDTYAIASTNVLTATVLGTAVVTSSLTTVGALNSGSITSGFGTIDIGSSTFGTTGTITGPSGTWDSGGMDIATGDTYAIASTNVLNATTLGTAVVTSSLTTVGALNSGSITSGFGTIDTGSSNISTSGTLTTGTALLDGTVTINGSAASVDFTVKGDNNTQLIFLDGSQDAISLGGSNVDGAALIINNLTDRTAATSVGQQVHIPAQTQNFDNASSTIAIGAANFIGIPTMTGSNATLTMTNAATLYIQGAPVAGSNVDHGTAGYSLWVDAGDVRFDGDLTVSGDLIATFGAIDNGTSNITTGGIIKLDVDGSAENAAGSLTMGAGNDAGIYFDGTNAVFITNGAGASGIILDSEDDTLEIKGSGTLQATFDTGGLDLVAGDAYCIDSTSVLNANTLGTAVVNSSLTSVGTITTGVWEGTDITVANGGTGVSTLTDGGVLLGSAAGAITAMAVLADSEMIVGNGSTDPVAESGPTLRTSLGLGTTNDVDFTSIAISGQKFQSFTLRITNNSGTMRHRMGRAGDVGATASFIDKISGASTTEADTPSISSSVDFTSGGGMYFAITSMFIFNTATQDEADWFGSVFMHYNDTDTAVSLSLSIADVVDINGTTRNRLGLQFRDLATGAVFNMNTTNWGAGEVTDVTIWTTLA